MFGIAVAALSSLSDAEKDVYQKSYCGLCFALQRKFGPVGQTTLSYDLTFLQLLYDSLYEPEVEQSKIRCVAHPLKKSYCTVSPFSDYCASLSIALAFHKCLDDVIDDNSLSAKAASLTLKNAYMKVRTELPAHCAIIEEAMDAIRSIEQDAGSSVDAASIVFAEMLSFCMACAPGHYPDLWSSDLEKLGYWLGRLIYMMDAAVDFRKDLKTGSYNPFAMLGSEDPDPGFMRDVLGVFAANATNAFEKMPIVENVHLLRGILYQGVWQKFNKEYETSI